MADPAQQSDEAAAQAARLFARPWRFVTGARTAAQLPAPAGTEVAFAGRSNVGKSRLINALVAQKGLARTSNAPGRTREVNFFTADGSLTIADLPGYGYATAPKAAVKAWTRLVHDYLRGRQGLARVFLLIDSRHGLKSADEPILDVLDAAAVSYQGVLTKADKMKPAELERVQAEVAASLAKHPAAHPELIVTSARTGAGIEQLRSAAASLVPPELL